MQAPQKFRTALSGFNREDVVTYIQYINARHEAEVNQLREELDNARKEAIALREKAAQTPDADPAAETQIEELTEMCELLEQEKTALAEQLAQCSQAAAEVESLREQLAQVTRQRDEALANTQAAQTRTEEELAAYRRAERAERMARNRASQMFDLANGTLADTAVQLDSAAAALGQVAEKTLDQIRVLQTAVTDSKQVLADAAATLGAIQPEQVGE